MRRAPIAKPFSGKVARSARVVSNGAKFVCSAKPSWLPGSETPAYLDGLPGSFGFDPLKLGETPANLERFQVAELINGRWAMLGVAGCLLPEILGFGNWIEAPLPYLNGGHGTYFGIENPLDLGQLAVIEFALISFAEIARSQETDKTKKIYPGGSFDPLGFAKGDVEELKLKEIKNGRLAMLAFAGFIVQGIDTGKGPIANLVDHIGNPWGVNIATTLLP